MQKFRLVSKRSTKRNSLLDLLLAGLGEKIPWHTTKFLTNHETNKGSIQPNSQNTHATKEARTTNSFSVACEWERCPDEPIPDPALATFLVERYYAYTYKYGRRLVGQVEHGPWPIESARLSALHITSIDAYEPKRMEPILAYMATHAPDSVLYSPGVGPIDFRMLRSV